MIIATITIDEIEDPPSKWFDEVQRSFKRITKDNIFDQFQDKTRISIVFVDDLTMRELNFHYLGKNSTTDVLSFSLNEKTPGEFLLGEIIISIDKAKEDAITLQLSLFQEIIRLLVHGLAHLLGFDHQNDQQEEEMKELENRLISISQVTEGVC